MTTYTRRTTLLAALGASALTCTRRKRDGNEAVTSTASPSDGRREQGRPVSHESLAAPAVQPPREADAGEAAASTRSARLVRHELTFNDTPVGRERALALVPAWIEPGERLPVLVALHGRGESVRGIEAGAYGWARDYQLERTIGRLREPPLTARDWLGFVDDERRAKVNEALEAVPFRGLIVVCPWVPDLIGAERAGVDLSGAFGKFIVEDLLPRVVKELPAREDPAGTGIDGVSLGGRAALLVGLEHDDRFGAVGTLQAAVQRIEAPVLAKRFAAAHARSPGMKLRLLSSDEDYFRDEIGALHQELERVAVPHEHVLARGPHEYPFNRGPGGIEMLLWHDRVLRGEAPV